MMTLDCAGDGGCHFRQARPDGHNGQPDDQVTRFLPVSLIP